ncbi:MAG TPA: septum formation initiator family protein [Azospirillaceae bacterium]|nr:septum formation initiator family protein [Azospirillaceae bacterium]
MIAAVSFRSLLVRLLRLVAGPVVGVTIVSYFTYHAIQGDRGLIVLSALEGELDRARAALAELKAEREEMENLARRLRPESIDPDLLDERARVMLNFSHPSDLVILTPKTGR